MSEANCIKILRALDGPLGPIGDSWGVDGERIAEHLNLTVQDVDRALGILADQGCVELLRTKGAACSQRSRRGVI